MGRVKDGRRWSAEVGQVLLCSAERVGKVPGRVGGVGELGGCPGDGRAGVGVVIGPEAVGVVFGVEPASELVEQLRECVGEQDEFADESIELCRPDERVGVAGAVVQLADGLGGRVGEFDCSGWGFGPGHGRPPVADAVLLAGLWRCR